MLSMWCPGFRKATMFSHAPVKDESVENFVDGSDSSRLHRADFDRFFAFGTFAQVVQDAMNFRQALESIGLDILKVGEYVIVGLVSLDEAEAFRVVEPLDEAGLGTHRCFLFEDIGHSAPGRT